MAVAAFEKIPFLPKLKSLATEFWRWLNLQTQVDLKIFLPVFGGTLVALALVILLIPSYHLPQQPGASLPKWASASRLSAAAGENVTPNAPAPKHDMTAREKQAASNNDSAAVNPLTPAPVQALETGPARQRLPKIADDGRRPWFVYSRPFDRADPRPHLAVVVADLGLNRLLSESAINDLPGAVTLIFDSQSNTEAWMNRARSTGHEVLLSAPMEPLDYPANDPGPDTLLSNTTPENNLKRLYDSMATGKGYVGITTLSGSRFTSSPDQLRPVLKDIFERGLLWFDARLVPLSSAYEVGQEMNMPSVRTDFRITSDKSRAAADMMLQDAELSARHSGGAVVLVYASPLNLKMIVDWAKTLPEKGFVLAPVTAMVE